MPSQQRGRRQDDRLSLPPPYGFAEPNRPELRLRDVSRPAGLFERTHWFVDALEGHLERPEMHADTLRRFEIYVCLYGFRWIHVHGLHEPTRLVRTDRQQCEINRAEPLSYVAEERGVRTVACEEYARGARSDRKSTPQRAVSIQRIPRGEMMRRGQTDRQRGRLRFLPPIELLDPSNPA